MGSVSGANPSATCCFGVCCCEQESVHDEREWMDENICGLTLTLICLKRCHDMLPLLHHKMSLSKGHNTERTSIDRLVEGGSMATIPL